MNAQALPQQPFHRSTRTAMAENFDATTGTSARTLSTSTLTLSWQAGELVIGFKEARAVISGAAGAMRARRHDRGVR
ncbi:hypothetical protein G7047_14665 [Diaphorobacter sp. HDW4A]|uniref:hypothetical protein n=1 Tax=Diaphorobacter sp. HDW4A TaxID=2714924 RepID=UPI001409167B|nr:hypothetical protein [Diaphorobacter sp. HDW4A]QIL81000.1 hypothetical protein G7047_14665 [Diaphorobacter sp. HDW4A]